MVQRPRGPPPEGGGKAGPKCPELLRNTSIHTQITEALLEDHCKDTGLSFPISKSDGQKHFAQGMPEFDFIFTVLGTLKI